VAIAIGSTCVMTAMESTGMQELLLSLLYTDIAFLCDVIGDCM